MIEKIIFWWGVFTACLAMLWVGAVFLDKALNVVLKTFGSYQAVVDFLWDRRKRRNEAIRRHGSGPIHHDDKQH